MRLFSIILLSVFMLAQAGPALLSLVKDHISVFIVDEEKSASKIDIEKKKEKNEAAPLVCLMPLHTPSVSLSCHSNSRLTLAPHLDMKGQPPDQA